MTPSDFWKPFEEDIKSYSELAKFIDEVFEKGASKTKVFAWRGHVNASWPLHSSLYRRLAWTITPTIPKEKDLYQHEGKILIKVHRWGLQTSSTGARLSILSQLAALQHYGAPTRLIDVTFNPWIAAWFAVEQKWKNQVEIEAGSDARLFAVDVTGRLINENANYRDWAEEIHRPWPKPPIKGCSVDDKKDHRLFCTKVYAWRPPHFDSRIAAKRRVYFWRSSDKQWAKRTETMAEASRRRVLEN